VLSSACCGVMTQEKTLATKTGVPDDWVEVSLAVGRRLSDDISTRLRRLQSGTVTISYTITLPPNRPSSGLGSSVTVADISAIITAAAADPSAFQAELQSQLAALGATYTVTIDSMSAPTVTQVTITTTTTVAGPENYEGSAFTREAFSPAHAVAFLAVAISALSF